MRRSEPMLRFAVGVIFSVIIFSLEEFLSGQLYLFLPEPSMNPAAWRTWSDFRRQKNFRAKTGICQNSGRPVRLKKAIFFSKTELP